MAATATFTCVCGVQKASSNHWLLATRTAGSVRFIPWDWSLAFNDDVIVLCGERCAAALLSRGRADRGDRDPARGSLEADMPESASPWAKRAVFRSRAT